MTRLIAILTLICTACATPQGRPAEDKPDVWCQAGEHVSLHGWCVPDHDFDNDVDRAWARALLCGFAKASQRPEFCDELNSGIP